MNSKQAYVSIHVRSVTLTLEKQPESVPFQKPVSKREAPDYYDGASSLLARSLAHAPIVIKRPMDLSTILRNAKARKYKNKAEFAADLDLIWTNCFEYNSQEVSPAYILYPRC